MSRSSWRTAPTYRADPRWLVQALIAACLLVSVALRAASPELKEDVPDFLPDAHRVAGSCCQALPSSLPMSPAFGDRLPVQRFLTPWLV
jgi:tellurite resistance protein